MYMYGLGNIGVVCNRGSIVNGIIGIELIMVGVSMNIIEKSIRMDDGIGGIVGIIVISVAAGETAIGLGMLVNYKKSREGVSIGGVNRIQG